MRSERNEFFDRYISLAESSIEQDTRCVEFLFLDRLVRAPSQALNRSCEERKGEKDDISSSKLNESCAVDHCGCSGPNRHLNEKTSACDRLREARS